MGSRSGHFYAGFKGQLEKSLRGKAKKAVMMTKWGHHVLRHNCWNISAKRQSHGEPLVLIPVCRPSGVSDQDLWTVGLLQYCCSCINQCMNCFLCDNYYISCASSFPPAVLFRDPIGGWKITLPQSSSSFTKQCFVSNL